MSQVVAERPARMPKLVLECPNCDARFNLKKYVADKRVRCRKCRAVMMIPRVDDLLTDDERRRLAGRPIDFETQKKVARLLSLPKLAILALLVALAVPVAGWILWRRHHAPPPPKTPETKPVEAWDARRLAQTNRVLEFPVGLGWTWTFAVGDGMQERKALSQSTAPDGSPQFEINIAGPGPTVRQLVRVRSSEAVVIEEWRGGQRARFEPALSFVHFPLYGGDTWTYEGKAVADDGAGEDVRLQFKVAIEVLDALPIGKVAALRVDTVGTRGSRPVDETHWYVKGKGLVQWEWRVDGVATKGMLQHLQQGPR